MNITIWHGSVMQCDGCGRPTNEGASCCSVLRCYSCNAIHRQPTTEELAAQTPFCVSMHAACYFDGLGRCPVCRVHLNDPNREAGR